MIYYYSHDTTHTTVDTEYIKRIDTLKKFYDWVTLYEKPIYLGVDTETEGFDPYTKDLITIQIGNENDQFVIYTKDLTTKEWDTIKYILENYTIILHNAKFDLKFFYHKRIVPKNVICTYLQELVLTTGIDNIKRSLEAVVDKYLGKTMDKKARSLIFRAPYSERTITYAANDVEVLVPVHKHQYKELLQQELILAAKLENKFVKVLAYTEYCGIYLNKALWQKKMDNDLINLDKSLTKLNEFVIANHPEFVNPQLNLFSDNKIVSVNWGSPKQVINVFKKLNIDTEIIDKETGDIKNSVEEGVIKPQQLNHPIIPLYLEYKGFEKVRSTYGEDFLNQIHPITGRIHTSFFQIKKTGRLSCGGKDKDNKLEYLNLQNIPREQGTRGCFTACDENHILIDGDFSGQEQIVLANESLEPGLLDFYDRGEGDMHSYICTKLFEELKDVPLDEIPKKHKDKRQIAKIAGFSINYGGNGNTIANNLSMSLEVGNRVYDSYFKAFPKLEEFFKRSQDQSLRDGYVLFNSITKSKSYFHFFNDYKVLEDKIRRIGFWDLYKDQKSKDTELFRTYYKPLVRKYFQLQGEIKRKAVNYRIQGTSAAITKLAGIYFFEYLIENNLLFTVLLSNFVHDEILAESPMKYKEQITKALQDNMEKAGSVFCKRVPLKASINTSNHWMH